MILFVLASNTVTNGCTWHTGLVTLAILLQAARAFTITSSQMFTLSSFSFTRFCNFWLKSFIFRNRDEFFLKEIYRLFIQSGSIKTGKKSSYTRKTGYRVLTLINLDCKGRSHQFLTLKASSFLSSAIRTAFCR